MLKRSVVFVVAVAMMMVAVAPLTSPQAAEAQGGWNESPMLAERVAAGELPPVEERMPITPAVVTPAKEIGTYGGDLRMGFEGTNPGWGGLWYVVGWENLVIWKPDFSGVAPNIAESWEVSEDVTEYTFTLREGLKWSDGVPFTTADIDFYINDVLFNEEILAGGPSADWLPQDTADDFELIIVDDKTFTFKFGQPQGTFLYQLATWSGRHITWFPRHYLEQFHADYNPDVDDLVSKEDGVEDWIALFNKKACGPSDDTNNFFLYPERPTLFPWIITEPLGTGTVVTLERNPYYFKVDPEGNQLPYIDRVLGYSYQDAESRTFAMLNGDVDYVKDPGADNRIIYFDAVDEGRPIAISTLYSDGGVNNTIHFNRNVHDPVLAEVFANKDFRIGMSYAINREELSEIVYFGMAEPAQASPLPSSPLYNERLATQYIEYDLDLANEYLDKVLPEKDGDGYRLGSDGERFSFVLEISNDLSYGTNWEQIGELLIGYWDAVGIKVTLNSQADTVFIEHREDNLLEATIYTGEGGAGITAILDPRYYIPGEYFGLFGNGWWAWRTNATASEQIEMPEEYQAIRTKYENEVLGANNQEAQIAAMAEILEIAADEFWVIGTVRPIPEYQPYSTRLGNQPDEWIAGWIEGVQKISYPEQWYIIE